jgi:hypothetical protein
LQGGREREGFEEWHLACVDLPAHPSAFFPSPFISPLLSGGLQRISKYRGVVMVHGSIQGKRGEEVWLPCHGEDAPWVIAGERKEKERSERVRRSGEIWTEVGCGRAGPAWRNGE